MSSSTKFLEDVSRVHWQAWSVLHTVRSTELSWPKAPNITESLDEFGTIGVMVDDGSGSTISAILISLERLVADALAGQALTDPRWQSDLGVLTFVNVHGSFVPESPHRATLAAILRSEINVVVVEASMNSPFKFVAKVFSTPRVKRWIKEWDVRPILLQTVLTAMLAIVAPQPVQTQPPPTPPPIVITVVQPQPPPPIPTEIPFRPEEVIRAAKELENSMQAGTEVTFESNGVKINIKKGPPPPAQDTPRTKR